MKNKFVFACIYFSCTAIFACSNKHSNANDELTNAAIRQTIDSAKAIIQQAKRFFRVAINFSYTIRGVRWAINIKSAKQIAVTASNTTGTRSAMQRSCLPFTENFSV